MTAKKILIGFFAVMGVLFSLLILAALYLYWADPFEVRPLLDSLTKTSISTPTNSARTDGQSEEAVRGDVPSQTVSESESSPVSSSLTPAQEDALRLVGINPEAIPSTITPEQESCFVQKLGQERVTAIKGGEAPTVVEILVAKDCL